MKLIMLLMMAFDGASDSAPDVQLLDFSAGYCAPCQQMVPILQRMEQAGFPIRQLDIAEDPELTKRFSVDRIPTLVLLVEGKEVRRFVGLTSEDELRRAMNKAAADLSETRTAATVSGEQQYVSVETELNGSAEKLKIKNDGAADHPEVTRVPEQRSLGDMFRRMIGKGSDGSNVPTLRGQDPASTEDITSDAMKTAFAATVRIRVAGKSTEDGKYLQDVGTGTIIHNATGEAIILTCAHLFLNIAVKEAVVEVEVFEDGKAVTYPAKLVGGDHDADLALLRIRTSKTFPVAKLSAKTAEAKPGQPMVSFGCNDGADPTRLDTKLVDINRYDGPPNFVCTIDPISGRSGGGLFSTSGELLGVCSCADRKTHEGLYAAHGAILELVSYCELKKILKPNGATGGEDPSEMFKDQMEKPASGNPESNPAIAKVPSPTTSLSDSDKFGDFREISPDTLLERPSAAPSVTPARIQPSTQPAVASNSTGPEITIVIDDKIPGSQKKTIVIPQASAWMLEMLTGETAETASPVTTALRPVRMTTARR